MYEQVEKPKENKSSTATDSVAQKKSNVKQDFGFVDNRPAAFTQCGKNKSEIPTASLMCYQMKKNSGANSTSHLVSKMNGRGDTLLIVEGSFGKLFQGNAVWGFNHIRKNHGGQFSQKGFDDARLIQLIKQALNNTHSLDTKDSDNKYGGKEYHYPMGLFKTNLNAEMEEWDIKVVVSTDRRVITAMPIQSESTHDRWF